MASPQVSVAIDRTADAAYIRLSQNPVRRTVEVTSEVLLDLDAMNIAVGIEVLRLDAEIPYTELITKYHIHSEVIEKVRRIRPSVASFVFSSGPAGVSNPTRKPSMAKVPA